MPSDKVLRRAANRLVASLLDEKLLESDESPADLENRVVAALQKNFREEAEIDREAERILEANRRQTVGMDSRTLFLKIRQKLARERGFVL